MTDTPEPRNANREANSTEPERPPTLSYGRPATATAVTIRKFYDAINAQLHANELAAHGIAYSLLNENTNTLGPYSGFSQVELRVAAADVEAADRVLSNLQADPQDVEPVNDPGPEASVPCPDGMLVPAAAFDEPGHMLDAAATLGAAGIECFLPELAARGDRPRGVGDRFVVRVREEEVEAARDLLSDESGDEPRCPKCGSWRVYLPPPPGLIERITGRGRAGERQCLRCGHVWQET